MVFYTRLCGVSCLLEAAASNNSNKVDEVTHKLEPAQLLKVKARPNPHEGSAQVPPKNPDG